jgi:hypothetical protein
MKCIQCKCSIDERPLFRTNPLGQSDAGWMCQPCIDEHHDPSLIDEETRELVGIISGQPQQ